MGHGRARRPDIAIVRQAAEVIRYQVALVHNYRIPRLAAALILFASAASNSPTLSQRPAT